MGILIATEATQSVFLITGILLPIQLIAVVTMEIIHLCIRIRRRRNTNLKCFLTWVGVTWSSSVQIYTLYMHIIFIILLIYTYTTVYRGSFSWYNIFVVSWFNWRQITNILTTNLSTSLDIDHDREINHEINTTKLIAMARENHENYCATKITRYVVYTYRTWYIVA